MSLPNLVTIDLDDQLAAESILDPVIDGVLAALAESGTRATFFATRLTVGAGRGAVMRAVECGHEVACLSTTAPRGRRPCCGEFRSRLAEARQAVEDATGVRVKGHRGIGFGVDFASEWVYDVLVDEGFEYDSSRFPFKHTEYGCVPVPRAVHTVRRWGGMLLEVPATTVDVMGVRTEMATTSAVRTLPVAMWRHFVETRQARGEPVVLHLKGAELRQHHRLSLGAGLDRNGPCDRRTLDRISTLVKSFSFTSVSGALPELRRAAQIIDS